MAKYVEVGRAAFRQLRDSLSLTQEEFASKLGLKQRNIARIEKKPVSQMFRKYVPPLAELLKKTPAEVIALIAPTEAEREEDRKAKEADPFHLTEEKKWAQVEAMVNAFDLDPADVVKHFKKLATPKGPKANDIEPTVTLPDQSPGSGGKVARKSSKRD